MMFISIIKNNLRFSRCSIRRLSSSPAAAARKVVVLGASNGVGQPLSLLLKMNPLVSTLSLYDHVATGVADDLSHVCTTTEVVKYTGEKHIGKALEGADLVVIPAAIPKDKPKDIFNATVGIFPTFIDAIAKYCPHALINIVAPQVTSIVPYASLILMTKGVYDHRKLFGVTNLDVLRAKTFYAAKTNLDVADVYVPVIGGHGGIMNIPLFSQAEPKTDLSISETADLTVKTQEAGLKARSPTLSMAYAGALFAEACLKGLNGVPDVVEYSYVQSTVTGLPFFASKVKLGRNGVEEVFGFGALSDFEDKNLDELKPVIDLYIRRGVMDLWRHLGQDPATVIKFLFPTYIKPL